MKNRLDIIPYWPRGKDPEIAVFAPRPHGGTRYNTDARYQYIADRAGYVVFAAQTPGTGRVYIDRATRRTLQPGKFKDVAAECAAELQANTEFSGRPVKLGWGDSGRGILVGYMGLHPCGLFDAVAIREGTNHFAPETKRTGALRLFRQPSPEIPISKRVRSATQAFQRTLGPRALLRDIITFPRGITEAICLGDLVCRSRESVQVVEQLAGESDLPLFYATFKGGITGTPAQVREFNYELHQIRDAAIGIHSGADTPALIKTKIVKGNHADLLNPVVAWGHLEETRRLIVGQ